MAYWDEEEPEVFQTTVSELRYFKKAGKLQIYQRRQGTAYGVTKGVVIDLAKTPVDELEELKTFFGYVMDDHRKEEF